MLEAGALGEQGLWCWGGSSTNSRLIRQRQHFQVALVAVKKFKTGPIGHKIVIQESWASLCSGNAVYQMVAREENATMVSEVTLSPAG